MRRVSISHIETDQFQGLTKVRCHVKNVHVMAEAPAQHYYEHSMKIYTYTELSVT